MIETIPPDTTDHTFCKRVLPRTAGRSEHFFDAQASNAPLKLASINGISIPQEVLRCRIPRKSLDDLPPGPPSGGMLRDIEVYNAATMVGEDHQNEQNSESHRRHYKEIDRYQIRDMGFQKSFPCRRRRLLGPDSVFVYGGLSNVDAQFPQLPDNSGRTPDRIGYR